MHHFLLVSITGTTDDIDNGKCSLKSVQSFLAIEIGRAAYRVASNCTQCRWHDWQALLILTCGCPA
jgi:hypothetical protein